MHIDSIKNLAIIKKGLPTMKFEVKVIEENLVSTNVFENEIKQCYNDANRVLIKFHDVKEVAYGIITEVNNRTFTMMCGVFKATMVYSAVEALCIVKFVE